MSTLKIWGLFSIENDYNQPDHNLIMFWKDKPSIEKLSKALGCSLADRPSDKEIIAVVEIYNGGESRLGNTDYFLEEITEGIIVSK